MLIDSHCHLDIFATEGGAESAIARAEHVGVGKFVCAGTEPKDWDVYRRLAEAFPQKVFYAVGLHPGNIAEDWEDALAGIPDFFRSLPAPIAVGEIGLDEHWMPADPREAEVVRARQADVFARQLGLARELGLPVIVHAREAFNQCVEAIDKSGVDWHKVVFHCFSEGADAVRILNSRGGRASFTGTITYKNAQVTREAALAQGVELLMLETDCPYLSPQKLRGKRNEPAYLRQTADFVSELFGLPIEELERVSTQNATAFFGL